MKNKAFTLIEVLITVLIISILSSASLVVWSSMMEKTREEICQQNELILMEALKFYIYDNEAVPTSLSKLVPEYADFAIASLKKSRPQALAMRKIYLALLYIDEGSVAWAARPNFKRYLGMNATVLRCPSKKGSGLSYGFADVLERTTLFSGPITKVGIHKIMVANGLPIIADCSTSTFSISGNTVRGVDYRHNRTILNAIFQGDHPAPWARAMVVTANNRPLRTIRGQRHDWSWNNDDLPVNITTPDN